DQAAASPDGARAFTWSGSSDARVAHWARLWDLEKGALLWFSREFPGKRAQVAFSVDSAVLAIGNHQGGALLLDAISAAPLRSLGKEKQSFLDIVFSPDGKTLVTWGTDKVIRLWDLKSYRETK